MSEPSSSSEPLANGWRDDLPEIEAATSCDVDMHYKDFPPCGYFRRDANGRYIHANMASARRYLRTLGYSAKGIDGQLSEVDRQLELIETRQNCEYAAPLAGHKAGLYLMQGRRILVTSSPRLITPAPGSWETLKAVFHGLLGEDQCTWFFLWLKIAVEAVKHSRHRRGQALIIAGPPNCGKSLCQAIITEILGGRVASPFAFLCGRTEFNSETFAAEHLTIEDQAASSDPRVRKKFGAEIKGLVANQVQRHHAKNREALNLKPIWRLSITLNDDAASLLVLPQWEEGLKDKLMLFHARAFKLPVDTSTPAGEEMLWRQLRGELPAFLDHLEGLTIPEDRRHSRFGVKAFHNPDLLEMMDAASDEMKLLEMIDVKLFNDPQTDAWDGFARELEEELAGVSGLRQLLSFGNTCGSLLGILSRKTSRVEKLPKLHGVQRWKINPPA